MEIPITKSLQQRVAASSQKEVEDLADITLTELDHQDNLDEKSCKVVDSFGDFMDTIFQNEDECIIKIPEIWKLKLCNAKIFLPSSMFSAIDLGEYWKFSDYSRKIDISKFGESRHYDALSIELLYNSNNFSTESSTEDIDYNISRGISFLPLNICTHSQIFQYLRKKQMSIHNGFSEYDNKEKDKETQLRIFFDQYGFEVFINVLKLRDKVKQLITDKVINIDNFERNRLISNIVKEDIGNYCDWILQITNIYYNFQFDNFINDIFYNKYFLLKKIRCKGRMSNFKYFSYKLEKFLFRERKKRNVNNLFCITIFNTIITLIIIQDEKLNIIRSFNLLIAKNKYAEIENIQNMLKLLMFIEISRKNMMIDLNSEDFIQLQQHSF